MLDWRQLRCGMVAVAVIWWVSKWENEWVHEWVSDWVNESWARVEWGLNDHHFLNRKRRKTAKIRFEDDWENGEENSKGTRIGNWTPFGKANQGGGQDGDDQIDPYYRWGCVSTDKNKRVSFRWSRFQRKHIDEFQLSHKGVSKLVNGASEQSESEWVEWVKRERVSGVSDWVAFSKRDCFK